jgi:hypothetical protein
MQLLVYGASPLGKRKLADFPSSESSPALHASS